MLVEELKKVKTEETFCLHNCAESVKIAASRVNYPSLFTTSCTQTAKNLKKSSEFEEVKNLKELSKDDIIFFDWYNESQYHFERGGSFDNINCEHVGVVIEREGNLIKYADFNSSQAPRQYWEHTISVSNNKIVCAFHKKSNTTKYEPEQVLIRRGQTGNLVKLIQLITGAKVDGYFGSETEEKVKEYQNRKEIEVDGIVGEETLEEFLKEW